MKRLTLISVLIVVLLMASSILAQDTAPRAIKYGLKAGIGLANFTGGDTDVQITDSGAVVSPDMKMGINFGLWLRYDLSPTFAVQPEVLYVMKGAKYEDGNDNVKYKLNYIQIPVLFKYMFPSASGKMAPSIFAGPFLGFLTSAKAGGEFDGVEVDDVDIKDNFKSTEFGVTFGAGLDFAAGASGVFTVDARYDLGLSKIPEEFAGETANVKNSNIAVFIGYGF